MRSQWEPRHGAMAAHHTAVWTLLYRRLLWIMDKSIGYPLLAILCRGDCSATVFCDMVGLCC